jgi:glycosyltransferase involved in cell wall biosynthesis
MAVSIVMPNFNNARFLRQTLASVVDDPGVLEIVIYDNGSTDESIAIAESFGSKIKVIRGARNLGATLGRHEAVLASSSDHICYLDGDDFLSPGAVSAAYRTLVEKRLDISLFDLVNVDESGANPIPFIIPPHHLIDGKEACELTLGGWRMHNWGVIAKSVYFSAWAGFRQHGYSDDELLTRTILLRAKRISAGGGTIYYRVVPKPRFAHHVLGINRTAIRTLALGVDEGLDQDALRRQQEMALRFLVGLLHRALSRSIDRVEVASLLDEYRAIPLRPATSPRAKGLDLLIRAARPLLGQARPNRSPA